MSTASPPVVASSVRYPVAIRTWAGHARTSMTLDVYSHVIVDPNGDEWREHWAAVYADERRPRVVPVWSEEGE